MATRRSKAKRVDDPSPELKPDWFRRARHAGAVLPELLGAQAAAQLLKPKRGRPPKQSPKQATSIRFSPEVLEYFRATGPGWQTRMDDVLRRFVSRRARRVPHERTTAARRSP